MTPLTTPLTVTDLPADLAARWSRRVIAVLLDQGLLGAIAYLASSTTPIAVPTYVPMNTAQDAAVTPWAQSGWLVTAVVGLLLMQAYLGATPGKVVVGIAVVREADGRPVGILRTFGRLLLHVLDAILMIGYLRPLWNTRRQTFADSIVRTVVITTRYPLPYRRRPGVLIASSGGWESTVQPGWRRTLTWVTASACLLGSAMMLGSSGSATDTGTERRFETCTVPYSPAGSRSGEAFALAGGSLDVDHGRWTERRLGIERPRQSSEAGIRVGWEHTGTEPPHDAVLTATFARQDGTGSVVVRHTLRDGSVLPGVGRPVLDGSAAVLLPLDTVADLGPGWTWSLTTTSRAYTSPACTP